MKNLLLLLILHLPFLLAGCQSGPPIAVPTQAKNAEIMACLPNAIMLAEGLTAAGVAARVLSIYTADGGGHAVCVYLYPGGSNTLWVWDASWGSVQVRAYWEDADGIAKAWMMRMGDARRVTLAEWR